MSQRAAWGDQEGSQPSRAPSSQSRGAWGSSSSFLRGFSGLAKEKSCLWWKQRRATAALLPGQPTPGRPEQPCSYLKACVSQTEPASNLVRRRSVHLALHLQAWARPAVTRGQAQACLHLPLALLATALQVPSPKRGSRGDGLAPPCHAGCALPAWKSFSTRELQKARRAGPTGVPRGSDAAEGVRAADKAPGSCRPPPGQLPACPPFGKPRSYTNMRSLPSSSQKQS